MKSFKLVHSEYFLIATEVCLGKLLGVLFWHRCQLGRKHVLECSFCSVRVLLNLLCSRNSMPCQIYGWVSLCYSWLLDQNDWVLWNEFLFTLWIAFLQGVQRGLLRFNQKPCLKILFLCLLDFLNAMFASCTSEF